jgi:predicted DNA-binding ribbon-helix-helix protein
MKPRSRKAPVAKRRTTLTLPADYLAQAKRIARARHVTLSAVISEVLSNGLRQHSETERSEQILRQYKRAFAMFSDKEMLLLDGVTER